jgi:hypothetical protein
MQRDVKDDGRSAAVTPLPPAPLLPPALLPSRVQHACCSAIFCLLSGALPTSRARAPTNVHSLTRAISLSFVFPFLPPRSLPFSQPPRRCLPPIRPPSPSLSATPMSQSCGNGSTPLSYTSTRYRSPAPPLSPASSASFPGTPSLPLLLLPLTFSPPPALPSSFPTHPLSALSISPHMTLSPCRVHAPLPSGLFPTAQLPIHEPALRPSSAALTLPLLPRFSWSFPLLCFFSSFV